MKIKIAALLFVHVCLSSMIWATPFEDMLLKSAQEDHDAGVISALNSLLSRQLFDDGQVISSHPNYSTQSQNTQCWAAAAKFYEIKSAYFVLSQTIRLALNNLYAKEIERELLGLIPPIEKPQPQVTGFDLSTWSQNIAETISVFRPLQERLIAIDAQLKILRQQHRDALQNFITESLAADPSFLSAEEHLALLQAQQRHHMQRKQGQQMEKNLGELQHTIDAQHAVIAECETNLKALRFSCRKEEEKIASTRAEYQQVFDDAYEAALLRHDTQAAAKQNKQLTRADRIVVDSSSLSHLRELVATFTISLKELIARLQTQVDLYPPLTWNVKVSKRTQNLLGTKNTIDLVITAIYVDEVDASRVAFSELVLDQNGAIKENHADKVYQQSMLLKKFIEGTMHYFAQQYTDSLEIERTANHAAAQLADRAAREELEITASPNLISFDSDEELS